jgi:predicted nuclease of predicted toxin-antitoxin system
VLSIAVSRDALLITEDKDFGELVFRLRLPHKGILLIRMEDDRSKVLAIAQTIAQNYNELYNRFAVINERKLRIKE